MPLLPFSLSLSPSYLFCSPLSAISFLSYFPPRRLYKQEGIIMYPEWVP